MTVEIGQLLFETGRGHSLSAARLYRVALEEGERRGLDNPVEFAFNGTFSLSINYLFGLGFELMLKSAIVGWGGPSDQHYLIRTVGHKLTVALDEAERVGFQSQAPNLREILDVLHEPYLKHWLRYERPEKFPLPSDFAQIEEAFIVLDRELQDKFWIGFPKI